MSSSALMSLGVKAMTANYAALQTTSNNIANANVVGYSRQQADLATAQGQFTGAGFFGRGVDVISVTRAHSDFLTHDATNAVSLASMDGTRLAQLQTLQNSFKSSEGSLGDSTSQLFSALSDLGNNPGDLPTRQVVLARAKDLAGNFASAGKDLDNIQSNVTSQLSSTVNEVNGLAQNIASLNQSISNLLGTGQPPNDLLDQRDRLISQLSSDVQVTRVDATDGSTSLFIAGGQTLVLGSKASQLKVMQDSSDASRSALGIADGTGPARLIAGNALGGGSIAGLLAFQNQDLVQGRNLIGQLAAAVGGALNQQQQVGLTLRSPLGQSYGTSIFGIGAPQALPNATNAKDAAGNNIGSVALTVTDPSALQASDYDLRPSTTSPGSWQLTRLSDGTVSTIASGDVVDGMRVDISNAQPADHFLLQPVSRAANGMTSLLTDPQDVAAASPLVATTAAANTGTATIASLTVNTAPLPTPGGTTQITFTDDVGGYSWQLLDASGAATAAGSGTWQAGQAVPAPPQDINGYTLQLAGVPKTGDVITVAPTPASAVRTNNGNAIAALARQDAPIVGGQTATNAWADALSSVGVNVQSAQSTADMSSAASNQAEAARSSQSGVNMDEEAARLIQYQQSYQAAAKVLSVAQTLFDTLLQVAAA